MTSTLLDARVAAALHRMFAEADAQMPLLGEMMRRDAVPGESSAQDRADALSEFYLPVTPEAGRLLYTLVRASRPTTVVEFGMSLGISAIHLASAVRDNGAGRVVTTELNEWKDLYLQVLQLLEPRLVPGALIVADNTSMAGLAPYLDYVRDPAKYVSVHFPVRDSDSMEISCRA
jgi:predicted O-methyltransferase YrrM